VNNAQVGLGVKEGRVTGVNDLVRSVGRYLDNAGKFPTKTDGQDWDYDEDDEDGVRMTETERLYEGLKHSMLTFIDPSFATSHDESDDLDNDSQGSSQSSSEQTSQKRRNRKTSDLEAAMKVANWAFKPLRVGWGMVEESWKDADRRKAEEDERKRDEEERKKKKNWW